MPPRTNRSGILSLVYLLLLLSMRMETGLAQSACVPGWQGSVLIDGESLTNWSVEHDQGSSGSLQLIPGIIGQAVRLEWDLGSGNWVQGKYTFSAGADLSRADIFGVSLHGGAGQRANTVAIMFADVNDVFYGYDWVGNDNGINQADRWFVNIAIPKKQLYFFFGPGTAIDWSRINRFFFVVKKPDPSGAPSLGGGIGQLSIDHVQYDAAANWSRNIQLETVNTDPLVASKAIAYILGQQKSTGLFLSWKEQELESPPPKAWLYDQALALIALTREGNWENGAPMNNAAQAARRLASFVLGVQKSDGHWARSWNPNTGAELVDDGWVGDQAWMVMALATYADKAADAGALSSAQRAAKDWLAPKIDSAGKTVASTEGNVDVWWAMISTSRSSDADRIKNYLLDGNTVWDSDLQYWWRGFNDPVVAVDTATWLSAFSRHPLVRQVDRGKAALAFVRKTLVTQSPDFNPGLCGLDGMGPMSIWYEGTAQYVAAGGKDARIFLKTLVSQQRQDGSMPGSPENQITDAFGWLSRWSGIAPTAWLYFAVRGLPFPGIPPEPPSAGDSGTGVIATIPADPKNQGNVPQVGPVSPRGR